MEQIKGRGMRLTLRALIIVIVFFIFGWTLRFTIFDQDISEDISWTLDRFAIPKSNASDEEGHIPRFANASMTKGKASDTPSTILAAGDIAKCDSEDLERKISQARENITR